jgi:transcriptional regulator with GAF, ATPase, and Fis domain
MTAEQEARARALTEAFVSLADTLVADYDVIDLLARLSSDCVALLSVDSAGLLLSDQRGALQVVSSSSEQAHLMELFQVQNQEGPCLDCFRSSRRISVPDLDRDRRWPRFSARALQAGYRAVHALPLRLRAETIGALNLFSVRSGALSPENLRIGQALADVATIGILQERAIRHGEVLNEQLQTALTSRVVVEQAKGVLAQHHGISMDAAFDQLRRYARAHNLRLANVARQLATRRLDPATITPATTSAQR